MRACVHMQVHICVCMYICVHTCVWVHMHVHVDVHIQCMCVCAHVCAFACVCTCVCICVCVCHPVSVCLTACLLCCLCMHAWFGLVPLIYVVDKFDSKARKDLDAIMHSLNEENLKVGCIYKHLSMNLEENNTSEMMEKLSKENNDLVKIDSETQIQLF